jgi:flagellar biosynthesis chaperone FliJ
MNDDIETIRKNWLSDERFNQPIPTLGDAREAIAALVEEVEEQRDNFHQAEASYIDARNECARLRAEVERLRAENLKNARSRFTPNDQQERDEDPRIVAIMAPMRQKDEAEARLRRIEEAARYYEQHSIGRGDKGIDAHNALCNALAEEKE